METEEKKIATNQVEDANQAYKSTLKDILTIGSEIRAAESLSVGSNKKFKEILNYNLIIKNPTQRLLTNSSRGFNLPGAIARFVWMMAANNRLADIEFYWGLKVSKFTDDGYTVPGSSYGARMFNASPGLDQIEAVIKRLKEDPSTRRAAVSIYHPIDAIRPSKDIPCTFGIFYHVRDNKLISTVVMRSNNAFILLPYNIFEFSLLAEIIAKEVGVEMGSMYYNALSMHIYEDNYEISQKIVDGKDELNDIHFPPMPFTPKPMEEVKKLIRLEAQIRHVSAGLNNSNINEWLKDTIIIGKGEENEIQLSEYWKQFYYLLLYFIVSKKTADKDALKKVTDLISDPYKKYLDAEDLKIMPKATQQDLFGNITGNASYADFSHVTRKLNSLEALCSEYNTGEKEIGKKIDFPKYLILREKVVGNLNEFRNIAARGDAPEITKEDFLKSVNELFGDK
ncbi:MAG TPA: thymidylate synthase [Chitinophagaceae bacterium]|nr:thymidylate synthase [Chitinophagaceae bacterium]